MQKNPIRLTLTEPQERFLLSLAKHPAFVAGFGAGKSEVMACAAVSDAAHASDALIGLYAPTYDLVKLIIAPRITEKLEAFGVPHKWNKQDNAIYTSYPQFGDFLLRTMENPERIVGYETYRAHVEELDTMKPKQAEDSWNKILGRNRQKPESMPKPFNRASVYTTPEGFRFVYQRWVKHKTDAYDVIQAPSYSNPFLPDDYVSNLRQTYPEELVQAYVEGRFVNLAQGTVYSDFDRATCATLARPDPGEPLRVGLDFNIGKMAAVIHVIRDGHAMAVGELVNLYDTPAMIHALKDRYPGHDIICYPDASGASRDTRGGGASESDIALLEREGWAINAGKKNPPVVDRVAAVNAGYRSGKARVNVELCPRLTAALEQQPWDTSNRPDKTTGHDHVTDAHGYFIHYEFPVAERKTFEWGMAA